jgi:hypothetical protein
MQKKKKKRALLNKNRIEVFARNLESE